MEQDRISVFSEHRCLYDAACSAEGLGTLGTAPVRSEHRAHQNSALTTRTKLSGDSQCWHHFSSSFSRFNAP